MSASRPCSMRSPPPRRRRRPTIRSAPSSPMSAASPCPIRGWTGSPAIAELGQDRQHPARIRRHRRPGEGRVEGRRARQPVPRQHPRGRRHRPCAALLRGFRRHPRLGQRRSGARRRDRRDRADAGRPRQPGEAPAQPREARQGRRQGGRRRSAGRQEGARRPARRQARPRGGDHRGGAAGLPAPAAHHRQADDVRAERRRGLGRHRQCLQRQGRGPCPPSGACRRW